MGDASKRPLHIPPWQIPYLEKNRIFELFHELGRELVIHQPNDHVLFLRQILLNASKSRDTCRVVVLYTPKVDILEIARGIIDVTKQNLITEETLLSYSGRSNILDANVRAKYISHLSRKERAYENGWILLDCIKTEEDAKALLRHGILPTHVLHFISPHHPPLSELLYCHVPVDWPLYRRNILGVRDVFKSVLKEIYLQQRTLQDVVTECVNVLGVRPAKYEIKPRVLIMGPRGSGRKTQAKLLAHHNNLVHIDFERLICETWMSYSQLGSKLRNCKNEVCLHSEILTEIIHKRVLESDCLENGWVLTGFPFSKRDFEYLDCIHTPPNRIIFLECDISICKDRLNRKYNTVTGSMINLKDSLENEQSKSLQAHPRDNKYLIDAELSYYCENYGDFRRYCGASARCINADQSERWIHETIISIIHSAPIPFAPRRPFQSTSLSSLSLDTCCCSPIQSQILDCYAAKV